MTAPDIDLTKQLPVLISEREILHKCTLEPVGPRITKVQTIRMPDGKLVEVNFWTNEDGSLYRVS